MKDLYNQIIQEQNFGFKDQYTIDKKLKLFKDKTKLITHVIKAYAYRVNYQYKTKRGNVRTNYKLLILKEIDELEAKAQVLESINDFNKKYPFRAISNVKILDISFEEILIPLT